MSTPLLSPFANVLPFLSWIPEKYWKSGVVPGGSILMTGKPSVDDEHLYMMVHAPTQWTVSYTGDSMYPQFSEIALGSQYRGQCAAFAKCVSWQRTLSTDKWLPWQSLIDFCLSPESLLPSSYQWLVIACFDGQANYALAAPNRKHVAILLDITRDTKGKPKSIIVIDQNYYSYPPYTQYKGKIARHVIPWGTLNQKWVGYARGYSIVNV